MSHIGAPAQFVELGDGTRIEIPRHDPTLRIDLWVAAFDGVYRFLLTSPLARELEEKCSYVDDRGSRRPKGIMAIYGAVARGRYELDGKTVGFAVEGAATIAECRETIRLALIGGAAGLVDGVQENIDAGRAKRLVENYLVPAPVEQSWDLAYLILHTLVHGRRQRPDEDGTTSKSIVWPSSSDDIAPPMSDPPAPADDLAQAA